MDDLELWPHAGGRGVPVNGGARMVGRAWRVGQAVLLAAAVGWGNEAAPSPGGRGWAAYGGGPESIRYSPLDQINRANVRQLEVAWTYDSGEDGRAADATRSSSTASLYTTTPKHRVVALDAATGALRWKFDSGIKPAERTAA